MLAPATEGTRIGSKEKELQKKQGPYEVKADIYLRSTGGHPFLRVDVFYNWCRRSVQRFPRLH